MKKNIFIFSGLGADERAFQHLDFSAYSACFVQWVEPQANDTIEKYATRLLSQINASKPILIGLSFGGIMALEIAKQIETEKVILIASAKTKFEIPFYFRLSGRIYLHKLLPTSILTHPTALTYWLFGVEAESDKNVLKEILKDTDPSFLKWALDKVARWQNKTLINNTYHIHGTTDKILPYHFVSCNQKVEGGGHLMILNKAEEMNKILKREI